MSKAVFVVILILLIVFCGCQTCRFTSVQTANEYAKAGYDSRIAVYKMGLDGKLWGAFLWTYHVQAQVLIGNQWKWVGMLGLSDSPTFSILDNEIYYWRPGDYESFLKKNSRFN